MWTSSSTASTKGFGGSDTPLTLGRRCRDPQRWRRPSTRANWRRLALATRPSGPDAIVGTITVHRRPAAALPAMLGMFVVELTDPGLEDVMSSADPHQAAVLDDR